MTSIRYAKIIQVSPQLVAADLFDLQRQYSFESAADYSINSIIRYAIDSNGLVVKSFIADGDSALASIWRALAEQSVDPEFPASVQAEVEAIVTNPDIDDPSLPDMTGLPFITIDNEDSRDLDQAMYITASDQQFTLYYALADAAHFVRPGKPLFQEALKRGASYYVPGFAVPMLPKVLSEGLVSLNAGVVRRAMVFKISFNDAGEILDTSVQQARMQSVAKLSYLSVEQYYETPLASPLNNQPYTATLEALRDLGALLIQAARRRNVVDYNRRSVEIHLSDDGRRFELGDSTRLQVERYNEQISLVCNAEGARLLGDAGLPGVVQAVYRVHDEPETERLIKFSRMLKGLIGHYELSAQLWTWRWRDGKYGKRENLSDYLQRLKHNKVDKRLLFVVQRHALMLSTASRFSAEEGGHHSLKLERYARFSSPMREIAGIYTHREYLQLSAAQKNPSASATESFDTDDEALREQVIAAANRSKEVQKRLNKAVMKKAIDQLFESQLALSQRDRKRWSGTVVSLRSTRVYVQLDSPFIRVKLYLPELARTIGANYRLHHSGATISDDNEVVFFLGQHLSLCVADYSQRSGHWQLQPQ